MHKAEGGRDSPYSLFCLCIILQRRNDLNVKDLYDTVTLTSDCSHNTFLTHLDTTINYLVGKYGVSKVIQGEAGYQRPRTVDTDIPIYDEYRAAICDNLLYLITGNSDRKTDFVNEANFAYKAVYARRMSRKRLLDGGYFHV